MKKSEYQLLCRYMLRQMQDSAHDSYHIFRVLYAALEIAKTEPEADRDLLITACLLHDVGRSAQARDPSLDHARVGSEMAYQFLLEQGCPPQRAAHVRDCIMSHRYRQGEPPVTIEAKILFDADKLDACGAIGIARTLLYGGQEQSPLYSLDENGDILTALTDPEKTTFFQEYHYKLKNLYGRFFTARGAELAAKRQRTAEDFFEGLDSEVRSLHTFGETLLRQTVTEDQPGTLQGPGAASVHGPD